MNMALSKALFEEETRFFTSRLLEVRGWAVNGMSYPILDVTFSSAGRKPFRVRLLCHSYDQLPASFELLTGDGYYLAHVPAGTGVINGGLHPNTGRPFICTPGSLEYHTHPSHLNDSWDNYKGKSGYDLGGMLTQIYNAWLKTNDTP